MGTTISNKASFVGAFCSLKGRYHLCPMQRGTQVDPSLLGPKTPTELALLEIVVSIPSSKSIRQHWLPLVLGWVTSNVMVGHWVLWCKVLYIVQAHACHVTMLCNTSGQGSP
jgi:hypothetical protein